MNLRILADFIFYVQNLVDMMHAIVNRSDVLCHTIKFLKQVSGV